MLRPWKLEIQINYDCDKAIYIQIADAIIESIKAGKLQVGDALPGSRKLAELLKVNRNTIIEALDVLLTEGWLIAKDRKGTFVADILPKKIEIKIIQISNSGSEETELKPNLNFSNYLA